MLSIEDANPVFKSASRTCLPAATRVWTNPGIASLYVLIVAFDAVRLSGVTFPTTSKASGESVKAYG